MRGVSEGEDEGESQAEAEAEAEAEVGVRARVRIRVKVRVRRAGATTAHRPVMRRAGLREGRSPLGRSSWISSEGREEERRRELRSGRPILGEPTCSRHVWVG